MIKYDKNDKISVTVFKIHINVYIIETLTNENWSQHSHLHILFRLYILLINNTYTLIVLKFEIFLDTQNL